MVCHGSHVDGDELPGTWVDVDRLRVKSGLDDVGPDLGHVMPVTKFFMIARPGSTIREDMT